MIGKTEQQLEEEKRTKCIFCKQNPPVGRTIHLFCERCTKRDFFEKMAALQRDTRFKEGASEYKEECQGREIVIKTDTGLSRHLQKKCVSFSPNHFGFKELVEEVNEVNRSIPELIKTKIKLRKTTQRELREIKKKIKFLKAEIEKVKNKRGKENKKKIKEFRDDLKWPEERKKGLKAELKDLRRKNKN